MTKDLLQLLIHSNEFLQLVYFASCFLLDYCTSVEEFHLFASEFPLAEREFPLSPLEFHLFLFEFPFVS
jgi:hypothetical protein